VKGRQAAVFWGVALVSMAALMLQLAITRLFSATMYYHYAFLAVSLALFGSGAAGVGVYLAGRRLERSHTHRYLAGAALGLALTSVVTLAVVLRCPLRVGEPVGDTLVRLACIYTACALPFLCAGAVISLAVMHCAERIGRLYFFDLCGAALGCLLLVPVLNAVGAVNAVLVVAVLAACAASLFLGSETRPASLVWGARASLLALAAFLLGNLASRHVDISVAKGFSEAGNVIFSKWNSFSRVTVWGRLSDDRVLIMIDADAATVLSRDAGDSARHAYLRGSIESLVYQLRPAARTLIIGPGGGNDVIAARLSGASQVDAVEVNPIIARDVMSSEPFRTYSGRLYEQPGVRLVVDEGRSFLRGSRDSYDVIQGTMVDTWAATAAGAYALTENNLYTVEAFRDYLSHLRGDGVLSLTRWHTDPSDQLLRLTALARAALPTTRSADAAWQVMIVSGGWEGGGRAPATFLLKKTRFRADEVRRIELLAGRSGLTLLYTPLTRPANDFTRLLEAADPAAVWRLYPSNIEPTTDNSPFFFHSVRLRQLGALWRQGDEARKTNLGTLVLLGLLAISVGVTGAFILGPLLLVRGRVADVALSAKLSHLGYFGCLGAAYIMVEVALIQKCILLLGHPTYALTVVLFALLCASGIGSAASEHVVDRLARGRLSLVLSALAGLIVVYVLGLSPLFYHLVRLERLWRIAIVVTLLAPLGFVMGMPMPSGIRVLARTAPRLIPWAWGVNGATSVLGSVAALVIALLAGFDQALLVAAGFYLLAGACLVWLGRRQAGVGPGPDALA
jgi:predicted membrane-bound spermidine synthase